MLMMIRLEVGFCSYIPVRMQTFERLTRNREVKAGKPCVRVRYNTVSVCCRFDRHQARCCGFEPPRQVRTGLAGFDFDKVNSSDTAYALGTLDGPFSLAGLVLNLLLAAFGGVAPSEHAPYGPLAAAKSGIEAFAAAWYFYQMPAKEKKWYAYSIAGAIANATIFALSLPKAINAWKHLLRK
jgi:hypothetical protein